MALAFTTLLRRVVAIGVVVMLASMTVADVNSAAAQEVDCERVTYNERIIVVCSSDGDAETGSAAPTSVPDSSDDSDSPEEPSGEDVADASGDDAGEDESDEPSSPTGRGDRGGRVGVDPAVEPETAVDVEDTGETGNETSNDAEADDAVDGDSDQDDDAQDPEQATTGDSASAPGSVESDASDFADLPVDPVDNTLLVALAIGAAVLAAIGLALFVAARRISKSTWTFE